jgi:hypothetical protein
MSVSWSGPGHEHDHSTPTTSSFSIDGQVTSWTDYLQCACGHRVPVASTDICGPLHPPRELQVLHAPMREPGPEAGR